LKTQSVIHYKPVRARKTNWKKIRASGNIHTHYTAADRVAVDPMRDQIECFMQNNAFLFLTNLAYSYRNASIGFN